MAKLGKLEDLFLTFKGIYTYQTFIRKSCYWSAKKMEKYQYRKLRKLLIESYANVPYYRKLFTSIGFDPRVDFKSLEDMNKIPILEKTKAREVQKELVNEKLVDKAFPLRTSGSTGNPFQVFISKNAWVIEQAVVWRHWKWSGYKFRDKMAIVRSYVPKNGVLFKKESLRNFLYFSPFDLNDENIAFYLDKMVDEKVKVLRGYPSSILAIANFVNRTGYTIPNLKMILVASERLSDTDRSTIEKAFKTKVTNHYGLAEVCVMMGDCEKHQGLHNYDDYGYLELHDIDKSGQKKIFGTNLHNLAMPLIRYETGDIAEVADKDCSCSRTLPVVHNIVGRHDSFIKTSGDHQIPTVNFYTMLEHFLEVEQWQIVQEDLSNLRFIIKAPGITDERIEQLRGDIADRLGSKLQFSVDPSGKFVQKFEGKINPFVSML